MPDNIKNIQNELSKVIVGKKEITDKILMAILARGHVLLEDVPGVGKTTTALGLSKILGLDFRRIQFTPDVVPSDVTGFTMYDKETGEFRYRPGAVMCNMLLADEINRTSSKTQSALLEVMEEGTVTIDAVKREVPQPFMVIATENPTGSSGTQLLPESQLDRFMVRMSLGYPSQADEISMMKSKKEYSVDDIPASLTVEDILEMKKEVEKVFIHDLIYQYTTDLVNATRKHQYLTLGVSPRGTLALINMASAHAYLQERDYVVPADVAAVFTDVCAHRLILNTKAKVGGLTAEGILEQILKLIPQPKAK